MEHIYNFISNAKVSIYSTIYGSKINGRWKVERIILPIDLYDIVSIRLIKEARIIIKCDNNNVPESEENICYKAVKKILDIAEYYGGVEVSIQKNIPVSSGLGGGSSNAAIVLNALNSILGINMSFSDLFKIAYSLGNDVAFFMYNSPCYLEDSFENLKRITQMKKRFKIALINPNVTCLSSKTKLVFDRLSSNKTVAYRENDSLDKLLSLIIIGDIKKAKGHLENNMIHLNIMPEYENAFFIKDTIKREIDVDLVFTSTGPYLLTIDDVEDEKLINICKKIGVELNYYNIVF